MLTRACVLRPATAKRRCGGRDNPLTDILSLTSARCSEVGILIAGGSWELRFPPPAAAEDSSHPIDLTAMSTLSAPTDASAAGNSGNFTFE